MVERTHRRPSQTSASIALGGTLGGTLAGALGAALGLVAMLCGTLDAHAEPVSLTGPVGYGGSPPSFGPADTLKRRDAAVAIARLAGLDTTPPPSSAFADVPPSDFQFGAIEAMWREGLTAGCSEGSARRYCPDSPVTRAQMAAFLGLAFAIGPPSGGQHFSDVPRAHPYYRFVEGLAQTGLAEPCPGQPGNYCPDAATTRGDAAAMVSRLLLAGVRRPPPQAIAPRPDPPPPHHTVRREPRVRADQSLLPWTSRRKASSLVLSGRPLSRSSSSRDRPPTF